MSEPAPNPNPDPFVVRPFREGDEAGLIALFGRTFGRPIDLPHWRWKLGQAAADEGPPNVLLALQDEHPVFQYAGIPTRLVLKGAPARAMVSVDTMTAPECRRRGLLTRVAGETYARWRDAGVDLVLGLPNEQWGGRAAALGWQPLFPLRRLLRPLRPEAMLAHRLSLPWLGRLGGLSGLWNQTVATGKPPRDATVQTQQAKQADDAFDALWLRCRDDAPFGLVRDRRWVQWRFLSCPSQGYEVRLARRGAEPVGYSAHRVIETAGRRVAVLAELSVPRADGAAREALWADLLAELREQRVEHISTLAVPGSANYRWLRRQAFLAGPDFSVQMVPLSARVPVEDMCRPEHWELSGAAFDVI